MKTSRLHSDKLKKYLTVTHLKLTERSKGFSGDAVGRLAAYRVRVSDPLPDPSTALDTIASLSAFMYVLEHYHKQGGSDIFMAYLNSTYNEFLGHYLDCMDWIATSQHPTIDGDLDNELLKYNIDQAIKRFKTRSVKPVDMAGFEDFAAGVLLKDDPAYTYCKSKKTIPYRIHKFIVERKIPGTAAMVAVCQDYASRWHNIEGKMNHCREKNIVDDWTWGSLFKEEDKLIADWKETMLILSGKSHGAQSAVPGLRDVSKMAES